MKLALQFNSLLLSLMLKRSTDYIDYNEYTDHNDYTTPSYINYMTTLTTLTTLTTPSPPPDPCGAHPPRVREWRHMTFQTNETASLNFWLNSTFMTAHVRKMGEQLQYFCSKQRLTQRALSHLNRISFAE